MYNTRKNPFYSSSSSILTAKRENLKPQIDWTEDRFNRILHIQLPGFKREEIKVQLNNAGKLFTKGSRLTADNKYIDLDLTFDVPKDVISDKISGKFEDGRLTLIMPKREITEAGVVAKENNVLNEATQKEESKQEEENCKEGDKERKEESKQEKDNEEGKFDKEKKDKSKQEKDNEEGKTDKKEENENAIQEKTTSNEANQREKSTVTEAMASYLKDAKARLKATHNEPTQEKEKESASTDITQKEVNSKAEAEEMSKKHFDDKDGDVENLKAKTDEGIMHEGKEKVEQTVEEIKGGCNEKAKVISNEVKNEKEKKKERMQKMKSKMNEIYRDTPKEIRKRINKMRPGEDGWLKSKYIDGAMEKINQNRNMIAVAIMAISVGLYVSHKLKARRG